MVPGWFPGSKRVSRSGIGAPTFSPRGTPPSRSSSRSRFRVSSGVQFDLERRHWLSSAEVYGESPGRSIAPDRGLSDERRDHGAVPRLPQGGGPLLSPGP